MHTLHPYFSYRLQVLPMSQHPGGVPKFCHRLPKIAKNIFPGDTYTALAPPSNVEPRSSGILGGGLDSRLQRLDKFVVGSRILFRCMLQFCYSRSVVASI